MAESDEKPVAALGAPESWGWTRGQRVGLGILSGFLILGLVIYFVRRPARVEDPVVVLNGERVILPGRVDPNVATVEELKVVPHVSGKVAEGIVAYREARKAGAADGVVFREPGDLLHVPGVTKAVLAQIRAYMLFPDDTADTQPMP